MTRLSVAVVTLLLLTVPLVGCIGEDRAGDDPVQQQDATDDLGDVQAQVYRAGGLDRAPAPLDSLTGVLPAGVPFPAGVDRHMPFGIFEPTIGVTSDGALYVSNLEGGPTDHSSIVRSTDQGLTWDDITPRLGPIASPPNSNDPYVYVDEATDRVYNLDMQGLACNYIQWSDDGGETWTQNPLGCGQPPVLDHPSLWAGSPMQAPTVGYENVVYLCVNRVGDSACATSLDGGITWAGFKTVIPGVDERGLCGGLHGHGTSGPDGTAYLPKGQCGTPVVAITQDDGVTWEVVTITEDVNVAGHEVAVDTDSAGNVYAFWMNEDDQGFLAVSTDKGFTWAEPMRVTAPDVSIARFPTIAAGEEGRVAMAYTGTTTSEDQEDMDEDDTWNAYLTTTVNALDADPVFATVTANDPSDPIARGPCEGRCFGEEGGAIGDFIDVVIDDDGRPWAAFVDVCTEDCAEPGGSENDVGLGFVGTLSQGPALRGVLTALAPLVTAPATPADGTSNTTAVDALSP